MGKPIGERLQEARAARGLTLEDVSEETKIRVRFLQALEHERWEVLPGSAYARGFLRTYANLLGLDAEELVAEYRDRRDPEQEIEDAVPQLGEEHRERGPIGRARARIESAGHGAPAGRQPIGFAGRGHRGGYFDRFTVAALSLLVLATIAALVIALSGEKAVDVAGDDDAAVERSDPSASTLRDGGDGEPAGRRRARLELEAEAEVWVCVVDHDGELLVAGETLAAGETRGPFKGRGFELTLGNGSVRMRANGERVPVPAAAEPLGFKVTDEHVRELPSAAQPTCE